MRSAQGPDHRGVEGLVHVGLWNGDVVLEPPVDRFPHGMNVPQDLVAFLDGFNDDPEGEDIVDLVRGEVLVQHLFVDAVEVLDASL